MHQSTTVRRGYFVNDAGAFDATRLTKAICLAIAGCAISIFVWHSLAEPLWLDELLTMALLQARSLPKLWAGIVLGIDGNPPLYLTFAWLGVHQMNSAWAIMALKLASVAMTIAATFAVYRVSVRATSSLASWMGVFLFAALNDGLIYAALELRTYAIYYLAAALAVLLQQRLIERHRTIDILVLGLAYAALTMAHTFGIVYVGCIALAGWLSQTRNRWLDGRSTILATVPAIIAVACWIPFFLRQSEVGKPYLWFGRPGLTDLLQTIFSSQLSMWVGLVEAYFLVGAVILFVHRHGLSALHPFLRDRKWQPHRYVALVALGILAFPLIAWVESQFFLALVVPRYFMPQLIFSLLLHVAFCEVLVVMAKVLARPFGPVRSTVPVLLAIVMPPAFFCAALSSRDVVRWETPCVDSKGAFFEADFLRDDIPVITESSHIFLPRATYGSHSPAYRFALDWDVVLKYPERGRGNATDFHILQGLKDWGNMESILTTEEILRTMPEFMVIEQAGRAWFHNLTNTRDVTAVQLAKVTNADVTNRCTLWKVTAVKAKP
jgi:hypothetical protein